MLNAKMLKALVIDQDPNQAKTFAALIKELFNKVFVQSDIVLAQKEVEELKPNIIFLNLTINQRSSNFETLEKLPLSLDNPVIIFGYNDGSEPELLAHAIETGIQDIFTRPYDTDIISTKITRFYQSEKTSGREIQYQELNPVIKATVKFNFKLSAVDENGLTFKGDHYISKGTIFNQKGPLIKEIFETESQELMITRTWLGEDWKEYFFFAEPRDQKEQTSAALRKFVLRKV
jgi:response regulator RpfG family c-di-GMP phosphodiesterase